MAELAISRAYIKIASVLVLDEPTSALDAKAEVDVYNHFQNMAENKSVLFISHRLGSNLCSLTQGKSLRKGSHATGALTNLCSASNHPNTYSQNPYFVHMYEAKKARCYGPNLGTRSNSLKPPSRRPPLIELIAGSSLTVCSTIKPTLSV